MFKISYKGTIIDSNINSLVIPKEGDKIVCRGLLYIVQSVDLDMGTITPEDERIQPYEGVLSVTVGVIKESENT